VADDAAVLVRFIHALAALTGPGTESTTSRRAQTTIEDVVRDGFGDAPCFRALLAEWKGEPVGVAIYWFAWSTWRGRPVLHLEDLFVDDAHRKRGIGRALMQRLATIAMERNCARLQWPVVKRDDPAMPFYESIGARVLWEWPMLGLESVELARLVSSRQKSYDG
jgi:GNAT superfamily N-acetyltransferase